MDQLLLIPIALGVLFVLTAIFVFVCRLLARTLFEHDGSSQP